MKFGDEVTNEIDTRIVQRLTHAASGHNGAEELLGPIVPLARKGKRMRARAAIAGWLCVSEREPHPSLIELGIALELYQIHALIHDDIIDHAPTRRGMPSAHEALASQHRANDWHGPAEEFGTAGAILAGDYLLSLADDALARAATASSCAQPVCERWTLMTTEVALGQYLDVRAENAPAAEDGVRAAVDVARLKSARYSVVHPVALGALLAGGGAETVACLDRISEPWGLAFQMRDDDLGLFGSPELTGKPSGDDLREGKRTILLALARQRCRPEEAQWLDSILGRRDLSEDDVACARKIVEACGARTEHEAHIEAHRDEGYRLLEGADLTEAGRNALTELAEALIERDA